MWLRFSIEKLIRQEIKIYLSGNEDSSTEVKFCLIGHPNRLTVRVINWSVTSEMMQFFIADIDWKQF